jgi:predicted PurR-regulated permease PerM
MPNFVEQSEMIHDAPPATRSRESSFERGVFRATLIVLATTAAAYVLWLLVDVLLLLFACALVSLILLTITNAIRRRARLPFALALGITVLGLLALLGGAFAFFGTTLQGEFTELATRLPAAWASVQARLETSSIGASLLERAQGLAPSGQTIVSAVTTALTAVGGALSGLVIVLVGGLYLAAQPTLYAGGLLRLIPPAARTQAAETLDAITISLRNWLKGQALGMLFVGVGTGLGLWIVGVPCSLGDRAGRRACRVRALSRHPRRGHSGDRARVRARHRYRPLDHRRPDRGAAAAGQPRHAAAAEPDGRPAAGGNDLRHHRRGHPVRHPGVLLATPLTIVVLVLIRRLYLEEDKHEVLASGDEPTSRPADHQAGIVAARKAARSSGSVGQPDHIIVHPIVSHEAERRPGRRRR